MRIFPNSKRSLKTVFDDCISSALFRIFAGEYTGISLVKPKDKNEKPYVYAIYQSKPISKLQDTLDDIDIDWDNNNLKSMVGNELIKNKTLHNEFLKKNEENSI